MLPFAALLSTCLLMPTVTDDIIALRDKGISEQQAREVIQSFKLEPDFKQRALGVVNVVYSRPAGSSPEGIKAQIYLACDNGEVINGYQHSHQGSGRGKRSRSRDEFHR